MIPIRRIRYWGWVVRALMAKHARSLVFGFFIGLATIFAFGRIAPWVSYQWFTKTRYIGVVGEFTPTTLPLSIQRHISYGLSAVDSRGTAQPSLAVSWEATESGKLYTFHLRPGVSWHSGAAVTAKDVNYNIRGVTFHAIDDLTLQARLATAYSPFPLLVSRPILHTGLTGFGQYRVGAITLKGDTVQRITLVPAFERTLPVLKYTFFRLESLAILAYMRGDIDEIEELTNVQKLDNWKSTELTESINYQRVVALFFNLRKAKLKDKSFRQALGYAIPETFPGERAYSPISQVSWAYSDKIKKFQSDMASVKRLLGDNAKKDATESAQLTIMTFPGFHDIAAQIAESWTRAGINTSVQVVNDAGRNFDVLLTAQDMPPDPDQYPFWHSTQTDTNITGYTNVKIDKLLEDGRQEMDEAKRKSIYAEFQRYLTDDVPAIFLYYPKVYAVRRKQ